MSKYLLVMSQYIDKWGDVDDRNRHSKQFPPRGAEWSEEFLPKLPIPDDAFYQQTKLTKMELCSRKLG
jgi:hypothetical protein